MNQIKKLFSFFSFICSVLFPQINNDNLTVEELKTRLFKTSRPKSALMITEACEKGFFFLEKTSNDQRKKFIKPTVSFIKEFEDYLKRLREISI